MKTVFLFISIFLLAISCKTKKDPLYDLVEGSTSSHNTSNELYSMPDTYHGLIQSPINILTSQLDEEQSHSIKVIGPHGQALNLINTGHTVQIDFDTGTIIEFEGMGYNLLQAHFHTPSEHQIDGVTFPMEMHFVNHFTDTINNSSHYLVIATLFKMGESNPFLNKFVDLIPTHLNDPFSLENELVFLDDLEGPGQLDKYDWFLYQGSLTTDPYTETVNWLVLKDIREASPREIYKINSLEGNNARHIQALYQRTVEK